jgi:alanine dehydrogenase
MIIGVPREIKDNEFRVGLVPSGAAALIEAGHSVLVEKGAGAQSAIADEDYRAAGVIVVDSAKDVWTGATLVVKVKEPRPSEYRFLRKDLSIFTFFHLAADLDLAAELIKNRTTAIAYETVESDNGALPILAPMSEVAGRLAVQAGAHYLMKAYGGRGVLLGGVPGVESGDVVIAGAGIVGVNAARVAVGLGAHVTVLDTRAERLRVLDDLYGSRVQTLYSNSTNLGEAVRKADLFIGAVHIPGARTPRLVTRDMIITMKKGAVVVDVSVDQGGCIETIRPTTHSDPVFEVDGVIHYGVANMPGAVPRTSTFALTSATLPFILQIANSGLKGAPSFKGPLRRGLNLVDGHVVHRSVAESISRPFEPMEGPALP